MAMELIEGDAVLVERELNMAVVEKVVDTRIFPNWKLMIALEMAGTAIILLMNWQVAAVLLCNGLAMLDIRRRWDDQRLRVLQLEFKRVIRGSVGLVLLICSDWRWVLGVLFSLATGLISMM